MRIKPRKPTCLNLAELFQKKYLIEYEESYYAQRFKAEEPWLMVIPCRYGYIYPHGGDLLAASVDGHPGIANQLKKLKYTTVHQDGDFGEATILFNVSDFKKIAKIMHPKTNRKPKTLSPEHKAKLLKGAKAGRATRWKNGCK